MKAKTIINDIDLALMKIEHEDCTYRWNELKDYINELSMAMYEYRAQRAIAEQIRKQGHD